MVLSSGEKLGPYEIQSLIGEGGMGQVYRARDTRLERVVALKLSKEQFSERFEREARAIAALNHPHICTLYDVGPNYLVMEFVDGEPLDAILKKGPLRLDRALDLAIQIAEALAAAHRRNIVHRDLKPANVILAKSGAKLLDFGLARSSVATAAPGGIGPTVSLTQEGSIVGTLQYMAPEQLESKDTDARTDIFALGCLLFEMVTGRPAFSGASSASLISAIMTSNPAPVSELTKAVPAGLDQAIQRCLAKDPDARWQCAADLAAELRSIRDNHAPAPATAEQATRLFTPLRIAVLIGALLLAYAGGTLWRHKETPRLWSGVMLGGPTMAIAPRVSPDGRLIAFTELVDGISQVAVMKPETGDWTVLTHARNAGLVGQVAWSNDGSRIFFDRVQDRPRGVYSIPLLGGDERLLLDTASCPEPLPDNSLLVLRINTDRQVQIHRFWPDSGKLQPLGGSLQRYGEGGSLRAFPDGKEAVFYGQPLTGGDLHLYALDLATNHLRKLAPRLTLRPVMGPRFPVAVTRDGHSVVVDVRAGNLHRITTVPRDGSEGESVLLTTTSTPWYIDTAADGGLYMDQMDRPVDILQFPVSGGVPRRLSGSFQESLRGLVLLPDGRLLIPGPAGGREGLLLVQPGRESVPLLDTESQTEPPLALAAPDQVVLTLRSAGQREIAVASLSNRRLVRRVAVPQSSIQSVAISRDSSEAYYAADREIWAIHFEGGQPRRICPGDSFAMYPSGDSMLVQLVEAERTRLVRVPLAGGPPQEVPVHSEYMISSEPLAPNAIAADGQIAVSIVPKDSWFYGAGVLDPSSGSVKPVPVQLTADYFIVGWGGNNQMVAMAMEARCTIWRFESEATKH